VTTLDPSVFDPTRLSLSDLRHRRSLKWSAYGPELLPAWVAEMDFELAEPIRSMLRDVVDRSDLGYPPRAAATSVRESFARRMADRFSFSVDPDLVLVLSEVVQGIALAVDTLTEPGEGVLVQTPVYPPFLEVVRQAGRRLVETPLAEGPEGFGVDLEEFERVVRAERPAMLLLCHPHNPTGRSFTAAELAAVGRIAAEAGMVVVSDEIHADLVFDGRRHVPMAVAAPEVAPRCVTLSSASKAFNLAGLRCAVGAAGSAELLRRLEARPAHLRGGLSSPGMWATVVAWEECGDWLEGVVAYLQEGRDQVDRALAAMPGVSWHAPEATYLGWLDFSESGLGPDPAPWVEEHAGVVCSRGLDFGSPGAHHARLNFATSHDVLEAILERLASALRSKA
jgi:cystathionine beta-lyase